MLKYSNIVEFIDLMNQTKLQKTTLEGIKTEKRKRKKRDWTLSFLWFWNSSNQDNETKKTIKHKESNQEIDVGPSVALM